MPSSGRERLQAVVQSSPPGLKRAIARAVWGPLDLYESATGRRPADVPPRGLRRYVGGGDFQQARQTYFGHLVDVGGLKPTDRVLDVGCGIGRMAGPLTSYLTEGSYNGMDIVPEGITWANEHIAAQHPRFRFTVCDVYNDYYNRAGTQSAAEYRFPFAEDSFDFVFATSLFTHLLPEAVENYLAEIARVTAPGGTCFLTFFVIGDEARAALDGGTARLPFVPDTQTPPRWWTVRPQTPEATIAFEEPWVRASFAAAGLTIKDPINYGQWTGRDGVDTQDIILASPTK